MSYQNNIAKESLSLENHIVWPCFAFVTQNTLIMHNPCFSQAIVSYLAFSNSFNFYAILLARAMDIAPWLELEYDDGGCVGRQKRRKSHIDAANQWAMEIPIN